MKEIERYLGATYSDSCQPAIMTETLYTFPDPDIPTITDSDIELSKKNVEMNYLDKKNTGKAIRQNMRKKDVYELYMHKI